MKKKIVVFAILAATAFFWLPANAEAVSPYGSDATAPTKKGEPSARQGRGNRGNNRGQRRVYPRRYRNYGQYRRTQVGNRRFRLVRRPYWRNGRRTWRYVRIYY